MTLTKSSATTGEAGVTVNREEFPTVLQTELTELRRKADGLIYYEKFDAIRE